MLLFVIIINSVLLYGWRKTGACIFFRQSVYPAS